MRDSLDRTRGGSIAGCSGAPLDVKATRLRFPGPNEFLKGRRDVRFRCSLDCSWELAAIRTTTGTVAAKVRGYGRWGRPLVATLEGRRLGRAPVRLALTLVHPVNPGTPTVRESGELRPG